MFSTNQAVSMVKMDWKDSAEIKGASDRLQCQAIPVWVKKLKLLGPVGVQILRWWENNNPLLKIRQEKSYFGIRLK